MVGGVLEAKKRWDIAKKVINSISKEYPGVLPVWPKVPILHSSLCLTANLVCFLLLFPVMVNSFTN